MGGSAEDLPRIDVPQTRLILDDEAEVHFGAHLPSVKGMSIPDACEKLLRHSGKPLKARELADQMLKAGYEYDKSASKLRASLTGSLDRSIRILDEGRFVKPEPGTYGLAEWEHKDAGSAMVRGTSFVMAHGRKGGATGGE